MASSSNTRFAVATHLLGLLYARPKEVQSSESLSGHVGSNPVTLRRLLGRLRAAGLVQSRHGVRGGWLPARDPQEVTLADVWRAVNTDTELIEIHDADPSCVIGQGVRRVLADVEASAERALQRDLERTTLADLAERVSAEIGAGSGGQL